jgi:DNA repair protein RadC
VFVLNARLGLKGWNVVSVGSNNETTCHPREVLRPVLVAAGHGFIVAHNHPSGDPSPSRADQEVTKRLNSAADLLQVRLIDHVVIGADPPSFLFREAGLV